jgi:LAO/AO transport system kinase
MNTPSSLATRGHLGGLSRSARDVVRVLDACGYGVVLVETVGVGQDELEITRTAHSTLVVMAPGMGDEVQAIKAGILECADVFAVNKADRDGADVTVRDLELMIALGNESIRALSRGRGHATHTAADAHVRPVTGNDAASDRWTPAIVKCVATRGEGIEPLTAALAKHRAWIEELREALIAAATPDLSLHSEAAVRDVDARAVDPYTATERLVGAFRSAG